MQVIGNIRGASVGLVEDGKEKVVLADCLKVLIDGRKTELGDVKRGDRVVKAGFLKGHLNYLELERDTHVLQGQHQEIERATYAPPRSVPETPAPSVSHLEPEAHTHASTRAFRPAPGRGVLGVPGDR